MALHVATLIFMTSTLLLSQEADVSSVGEEEFNVAFSDNFSKDTRPDYAIDGSVGWKLGRLFLGRKTSVSRKLTLGAKASVQTRLAWRPDHATDPMDVVVWLHFHGATSCYIKLSRGASTEGVMVSLSDTTKNKQAILIRDASVESELSRLKVDYRYGLVTVTDANQRILTSYVENRTATIRQVDVSTTTGVILEQFSVSGTRPFRSDFNEKEQKQLSLLTTQQAEFSRALNSREYKAAERAAEEIIAVVESVLGTSHPSYSEALNNLAGLHYQFGNYLKAVRPLKDAVAIREQVHGLEHPEYATSLNNLAAIYTKLGEYSLSEQFLSESIPINANALGQNHARHGMSLQNLANLHHLSGKFDRAAPLYEQAAELLEQHTTAESKAALGACLQNLAGLHFHMGNYDQSESAYRKALKLISPADPNYATTLKNRARLYTEMGDYRKGEQLCEEALEILSANPASIKHATCLIALANLQTRMRKFDCAELLFEKAIAIEQRLLPDSRELATSHRNLASLLHKVGKDTQAATEIDKAVQIAKRRFGKESLFFAETSEGLAFSQLRQRDAGKAEATLGESIRVKQRMLHKEHPELANSYLTLGVIRQGTGDTEGALRLFEQAENISRRSLNKAYHVQSERQQRRHQNSERECLDWLLTAYLKSGSHQVEALEATWRWKGPVTLRQRAFRSTNGNPTSQALFKSLRSVSQQLSTLTDKFPDSPPEGSKDFVWKSFERKQELWKESFDRLTEKREELEREIADASSEFLSVFTPLTVTDLQTILPQGTAYVDFVEFGYPKPDKDNQWIFDWERHYLAFVVVDGRDPVMLNLGSADDLDKSIEEFRMGFAVRDVSREVRSNSQSAGLAVRRNLWEPIEAYLDGISTVIISPEATIATLPFSALPGRKNNRFLLEEYRLTSIPFANLLLRYRSTVGAHSSAENRSLLLLGDVDYDSSPRREGELQEPTIASPTIRLEKKGSRPGNSWSPLTGTRNESQLIESLHRQQFSSDEHKALYGPNATEEAFCLDAPRFTTLHIATHGFFEDPSIKSTAQADSSSSYSANSSGRVPFIKTRLPGLLSGVVLAGANKTAGNVSANDGILRSSEIETLSLGSVDLVTLAACETGLGAVAGGEGIYGLQRAFQVAGASSVVASLWRAHDRATQELMKQFYTNLWIKRESKIDALRNAQIYILNNPMLNDGISFTRGKTKRIGPLSSDPKGRRLPRTDPYFWAAWTLSGDWR